MGGVEKNWPFANPPHDHRLYRPMEQVNLKMYAEYLKKRNMRPDPFMRSYYWDIYQEGHKAFPKRMSANEQVKFFHADRWTRGMGPAVFLMAITIAVDKTFGIWESRYGHLPKHH